MFEYYWHRTTLFVSIDCQVNFPWYFPNQGVFGHFFPDIKSFIFSQQIAWKRWSILYITFTKQLEPDLANYKDSQQNHFMDLMSTQNDRKLLDEVHEIMRLHHYSIYTEIPEILREAPYLSSLFSPGFRGRYGTYIKIWIDTFNSSLIWWCVLPDSTLWLLDSIKNHPSRHIRCLNQHLQMIFIIEQNKSVVPLRSSFNCFQLFKHLSACCIDIAVETQVPYLYVHL